jgi:branched-subunit amino acid aminotransferase/4-amino-4-deoxychorismate lyase
MSRSPLVYVAGKTIAASDAAVSIRDAALLHGLGVFETLRTYSASEASAKEAGGRPFRLRAHLARLRAGAAFLGFRVVEPDDRIAEIVAELVEANAAPDARVRITATGGHADVAAPSRPTAATLIVTAEPLAPYASDLYERGAAAVLSTIRVSEADPTLRHKTTSRARHVLALRGARAAGALEAIFLNSAGRVAEGTVSNIFVVEGGGLATPPPEEGLLPGIARATVLELAEGLAIAAAERPITIEELRGADEVFLTNSIMEVMPVTRLEGQAVGAGKPGPVTRRLAAAYKDLVAREIL